MALPDEHSPLPDLDSDEERRRVDLIYAGLDALLERDDMAAADAGELLATAQLDEDNTPPEGRWRIEDDGAAEWAMRHLREQQQVLDRLNAQYNAYVDRVETWHARMATKPLAFLRFCEAHLRAWALRQREATGQATQYLPSGKISTRKVDAGGTWRLVATHKDAVRDMVAALARLLTPEQLDTVVEWAPKVRARELDAVLRELHHLGVDSKGDWQFVNVDDELVSVPWLRHDKEQVKATVEPEAGQ